MGVFRGFRGINANRLGKESFARQNRSTDPPKKRRPANGKIGSDKRKARENSRARVQIRRCGKEFWSVRDDAADIALAGPGGHRIDLLAPFDRHRRYCQRFGDDLVGRPHGHDLEPPLDVVRNFGEVFFIPVFSEGDLK